MAGYILKNTETGGLIQLAKYKEIKGFHRDTYEVEPLNDCLLDTVEIVIRGDELERYLNDCSVPAKDTRLKAPPIERAPLYWHESLEEIFLNLQKKHQRDPTYNEIRHAIKALENQDTDSAFMGFIKEGAKGDVFDLNGTPTTTTESNLKNVLTKLRKKNPTRS
jgi:hypothetical protein